MTRSIEMENGDNEVVFARVEPDWAGKSNEVHLRVTPRHADAVEIEMDATMTRALGLFLVAAADRLDELNREME